MKSNPFKNFGPMTAIFIPAAALLGLFSLVRVALLALSWKIVTHDPWTLFKIFSAGFRFDLFMAGALTLPLAIYLALLPSRFFQGPLHQAFLKAKLFLFLGVFFFLSVVEIAFFDEFEARFNYIAVDYLLYPTEVANNIWQSYPVLWILLGVTVAAGIVFHLTRHTFTERLKETAPFPRRAVFLGTYILFVSGLYFTCGMNRMQVGRNRVENEIAGNGYYTFFFALWSNDLNYTQYYRTMDPQQALARVARLLQEPEAQPTGTETPNPLERRMTEDGKMDKPNIVILVEESFGAEFTGALANNPENLTPNFDKLARDGVLFTNFYATGSRTVRGLEAILCGFPPIPGESILKRNKSHHIFTLADILKVHGYDTLFIYGGRGLFDNMRHFMTDNGFDRFIEQKDFINPTFTTAWGVADEDIFHRAVDEFDSLDRAGKHFFATVLSVSNHKPYTYPEGRIDLDPKRRRRQNAVKYSDWAIGDFFARAEKRPFFNKTVFVVIGDHGARVYGADFIPIKSYEVPFLIYAPGRLAPSRIDTLACSMDVAPTLLGLTNFSFDSVFFGRDLFDVTKGKDYALMQHDREIGMLRDDRLAVLGLMKTAQVYRYDRPTHSFSLISPLRDEDKELISDSVAIYQTAYTFYNDQMYRLNEEPSPKIPTQQDLPSKNITPVKTN